MVTILNKRILVNNQHELDLCMKLNQHIFDAKGLVPSELPEVMEYIVKTGYMLLQYLDNEPNGMFDMLPFSAFMKTASLINLSKEKEAESSLVTIAKNHEKAFRKVLSIVEPANLIYYHDIAILHKNNGNGSSLLQYALSLVPEYHITCFVDATNNFALLQNSIQLTPNEPSIALQLRHNFVIVDYIHAPLFNKEVGCYAFFNSPQPLQYYSRNQEKVQIANTSADAAITALKHLFAENYIGIAYSRETKLLTLAKRIC